MLSRSLHFGGVRRLLLLPLLHRPVCPRQFSIEQHKAIIDSFRSRNFHTSAIRTTAAASNATPLCKLETFMRIRFTCAKCETNNQATFHRSSYASGVVLVKCTGCSNYHIIADNCGWFSDLQGKRNVEEILAEKGDAVKRNV